MEILRALFIGMMLTLLTLALAIGFVVSLVFAIGRLGTAIETAIKQRRKKNLSPQPDRRSSGSVGDF
jgi:cell division protein FtsN